MWRYLLLFLSIPSLAAIAGPPFNYSSAVSWADETVKANIPASERIYVFGPAKVSETYLLNNEPAKHDVSVRRILRYRKNLTLGGLLKGIDKASEQSFVSIYRRDSSGAPVKVFKYADALKSDFRIRPNDAIQILIPRKGFIL